MQKGLFITIEGPDGSGKTTQIKRIEDFLFSRGVETLTTREPGGTNIGEKIRSIILDKTNIEMDSMTEALLYAASRSQHVKEVIKPALDSGKTVICDRFVDSSIAYQGYGRKLGNSVKIINDYAIDGCLPDVTFLFKMDPAISKKRIKKEYMDRIEMEQNSFHLDVYKGYLELETENTNRIIGIDATRSIEDISKEIITVLERLIQENAVG